jgi:hypothetical protein
MLDGIFGAAGTIAAAGISAKASKEATKMQIDALNKQRDFVYSELDPAKISPMALEADIDRAKSRLALQGITDPKLLAARYAAQDKMLSGVEGLGTGPAAQVEKQAVSEALSGNDVASQMKQRLIDNALTELNAGATLPPDVQAEIVRAGLERSGSVSGAATQKGLGGNITREMVGERALALKSERQGKAMAMTQAAAALEQNRASLLGSLFPSLKTSQLADIGAAQSVMASGAAEIPEAGLSGESVANLWMARVGATNQLAQASADALAKGAMAQGQAWSGAVGGGTRMLSNTGFPSNIAGIFKSGAAPNPYSKMDSSAFNNYAESPAADAYFSGGY